MWAEGSRYWVGLPPTHLLTKSLIHLFSRSLHTLPTPQTVYYSFCFLPSSPAWRWPGACDSHTSTRTHPNVRACTYTRTHRHTDICMRTIDTFTHTRTQQWSYPEGHGAGELPHTTPTHHVYTHRHTCASTPPCCPLTWAQAHTVCVLMLTPRNACKHALLLALPALTPPAWQTPMLCGSHASAHVISDNGLN